MDWETKMYKTYLRKYNIPNLTRYSKSSAQREYSCKSLRQNRSQINNLLYALSNYKKNKWNSTHVKRKKKVKLEIEKWRIEK